MLIFRSACLAGVLALTASLAWAQAPSPAKPKAGGCPPPVKFRSVSIHARDTVYEHVDGYTNEGFSMRGVTLSSVIQYVFLPQRTEGLPDWAKKERYDVIAEIDPDDCCRWANETPEEESLTVQDFLREKLKLQWHRETRMVRGFDLVVGKKGTKLVPAPPPADTGQSGTNQPMSFPTSAMAGKATSMKEFAEYLSTQVGHSVVDKTELAGRFKFSFQYPRGQGIDSTRLIDPDGTPVQPTAPPPIFDDVERLGLELKGTKVPVDVLVIDQIERPSEN